MGEILKRPGVQAVVAIMAIAVIAWLVTRSQVFTFFFTLFFAIGTVGTYVQRRKRERRPTQHQ
jgi:hypothetical protein